MDAHVGVTNDLVAVLGLAFKVGTDDVRVALMDALDYGDGTRVPDIVAYDSVAAENLREHFPVITYAASPPDALEGAVAALVVTDWEGITGLDGGIQRDGDTRGDRRPPRDQAPGWHRLRGLDLVVDATAPAVASPSQTIGRG